MSYISYRFIAEQLGLKAGDIVYLSSDILKLAYLSSLQGEEFDIDTLINSFLDILTSEGTLLIPTFHFDFSNRGIYDYNNTPCSTGALGNQALKRKDFKRTLHPMHSFAVWGHDQHRLCTMQNLNSFGEDSPFGYMHENNVIQIMLGADYQQSMTFVHYVEFMANVPYRFLKNFSGHYIDADGQNTIRTYEYPARYLELESIEKFNRIGKILEEKGASLRFLINGISIIKCFLGESYEYIYNDAESNMCRNLYDFNCEREKLWNGHYYEI